MKKVTTLMAIPFIIMSIILYLLGVIIEATFDITQWEKGLRVALAISIIIVGIISAGIYGLNKNK